MFFERALPPFFFNPSPCTPGILMHVASPCLCLPLFLKMSFLSFDAWRTFTLQSPVGTASSETVSLTSQAGLLELFVYSYYLRPTYGSLALDWYRHHLACLWKEGILCFFMLVLTGRDKHMA